MGTSFPLAGAPLASRVAYSGAWPGPSAAAYSGQLGFFTDIGPNGSFFLATSSGWTPLNGHVLLARSAVAASVTGTASETALATVDIPAGLMGTNGQLRITTLWSYTNNANAKTLRVRLGGIGGTSFFQGSATSLATNHCQILIRNRNSASSQVGWAAAGGLAGVGSSTSANTTGSIDTSVLATLVISGQLADTLDTASLESYTVELLR